MQNVLYKKIFMNFSWKNGHLVFFKQHIWIFRQFFTIKHLEKLKKLI